MWCPYMEHTQASYTYLIIPGSKTSYSRRTGIVLMLIKIGMSRLTPLFYIVVCDSMQSK